MNTWKPTLIEVLRPRTFAGNPHRAAVTRTIRQPELDEFERLEALSKTRESGTARRDDGARP